MKFLNKLPLLLLCTMLMVSCATKKKKKEDISWLSRFYQNTTAEYNGYFNANVLLGESIDKLNALHRDNYTKVLDLYPYVSVDNPQSQAADLDKAIEKVSVVIALHRVSDWTDDCYLLMGKAQYLKHDFESAEETLEYMTDQFSPDKMPGKAKKKAKKTKKEVKEAANEREKARELKKEEAKKKNEARKKENEEKKKANKKKSSSKKKTSSKKTTAPKDSKTPETTEKKPEGSAPAPAPNTTPATTTAAPAPAPAAPKKNPDSYFMRHRPCYQEGVLWLARTYIERENYDDASRLLNQLDKETTTFSDIRRDLCVVQAYFYLKQKQYDQALPYLNTALETLKNKKEKARVAYIIAQINQLQGKSDAAYAAFGRVLKMNTPYEMEFNARINMVQNAWLNGKGSSEDAVKNLNRMVNDSKNKEYLDQVYFAIASVNLKTGNKEEAIKNLKLSLANNKDNKGQKAESYLLLAQLYFDDEKYVEAKSYYDSTLTVLATNDERHDEVSRYANNLTDIAKNIQIITLQDSLLRISAMSDKEKRQLAKKLKEEQEKAAALASADKDSKAAPGPANNRFRPPGATFNNISAPQFAGSAKPSTFFAYNDQALRKGKKDFDRKWASRPLEDNWRRINKRSNTDLADNDTSDSTAVSVSDSDVSDILKDVPATPEAIEVANSKIMEAMYTLGTLYHDRLKNEKKTTETLEKLNERYPANKHEVESWYYLYLAFTELNNRGKAKEYYDKLVAKYPNTTYARVLQDPDFLKKSKEEENKLARYYDETYASFKRGEYQAAVEKIAKANSMFGANNAYKAKFALLNVMCSGSTLGKDAYIGSLKEFISKYPDTPEQKRAKEMLRLLEGKGLDDTGEGIRPATVDKGSYKEEDDKLHYMVVLLTGKSPKLEDSKVMVSDYNRQYHKLDNLVISNILLGNDRIPVILIRKFKDKATAMKYYEGVQKNKSDFLKKETYEMFAISQDNYRILLSSKNLDEYRDFYQEHYLNK